MTKKNKKKTETVTHAPCQTHVEEERKTEERREEGRDDEQSWT